MASGWVIGVMVELADEPAPLRHFFAVGKDERAQAEWKAIDHALRIGQVATSPVGGLEPVHAIGPVPPRIAGALALKPGEVRPLGRRWPRRWIGSGALPPTE